MNPNQANELRASFTRKLSETKTSFWNFCRDFGLFVGYLFILALPAGVLIVVVTLISDAANWPAAAKAIAIVVLIGAGLTLGAALILRQGNLARVAVLLARLGRWLDMRANWNRFDRTGWRRAVAMHGHTWKPTALAVLFVAVMTFGPDWWRQSNLSDGLVPGALLVVTVGLILGLNYWSNRGATEGADSGARDKRYCWSIVILWLIIATVTAFSIFLADPAGRSTEHGLYRHLWQFLAAILLILLIGGAFLARMLFVRYVGIISKKLVAESGLPQDRDMSLPEKPSDKELAALSIDWKRFGRSLVKAPVYHSFEILFFLSLPALLVAHNSTMVRWAFYSGLAAWVLYAMGEMHERLAHLLSSLRRMFFLGGQLVISLAVILLAAGRLFDNSYITTVVEGQGWGPFSNVTLLSYICSSYIAFWFYEYWTNRLLNDRLIAMLRCRDKTPGRVAITDGDSGQARTLQIHGGSRFANVSRDIIHRTYGRMKLLDRVLGGKKDGAKWKEKNLVLQHRIRFYFTALNIALIVPLAFAAYVYKNLPQRAEIQASTEIPDNKRLFDLRSAAFPAGSGSEIEACDKHTIVLAASGGGTRAALYAYSVLRGLRQIELGTECSALHRVVLLSGVSGGSAALAYFKVNRQALLDSLPGEQPDSPWRKFRDSMVEPFIQDVVQGASEMRLLYGCKRGPEDEFREGLRLSSLLRESFDRRLGNQIFKDGCAPIPTSSDHGDYRYRVGLERKSMGIGLIFNTTLAGRFPVQDRDSADSCPGENMGGTPATAGCTMPISTIESTVDPPQTTSFGKGGRLVFTNLEDAETLFPSSTDPASGERPIYTVIADPDTPLATAAALSANFPPVFPNAAVDKGNLARYWVTDGGAADNRGIISLLHVMQKTIGKLAKYGNAAPLPTLHIVLADASAADLAFAQDRGVGAALGAAERFASQIIVDKRDEIRRGYKSLPGSPDARFHNLVMPLALRSNGGVGTHWMLPDNILLRPPFGTTQQITGQERRPPGEMTEPCDDASGELGFPRSLLRFLSLRKAGCEIDREEILTLFDMLHDVNGGQPSDGYEKIAEKKPNILKWLCEEPPVGQQHEESWRGLVEALVKPGIPVGYCPKR